MRGRDVVPVQGHHTRYADRDRIRDVPVVGDGQDHEEIQNDDADGHDQRLGQGRQQDGEERKPPRADRERSRHLGAHPGPTPPWSPQQAIDFPTARERGQTSGPTSFASPIR